MSTKDDTISKVYHDMGGYGSITRTLKEAKEIDPTIKEADVRNGKTKTYKERQFYVVTIPLLLLKPNRNIRLIYLRCQ